MGQFVNFNFVNIFDIFDTHINSLVNTVNRAYGDFVLGVSTRLHSTDITTLHTTRLCHNIGTVDGGERGSEVICTGKPSLTQIKEHKEREEFALFKFAEPLTMGVSIQ